MHSITLLVLAACAFKATESADWDYDDPSTWGNTFPNCNKKKQSPINVGKLAIDVDPELHKLQAVNYNETRTGDWTVTNNGHSLVVAPALHSQQSSSDPRPYVVFNHVAYELAQFHFHWGRNDSQGSEHQIDGKEYPAEVHFVHYNKKYPNISVALPEPDGLLVWGFLFVIDSQNNTEIGKLVDAVPDVQYKENSTTIPYFPPQNLFPTKWDDYFHYSGSLTTPSCDESVQWFVNQDPMKISSYQVAEFRKLYADKTGAKMISLNYRPVQDLNGRKVKSRKVDKSFIYLTPSAWDYKSDDIGTSKWPTLFPICRDNLPTSRQSPINIESSKAKYNPLLKKLELENYANTPPNTKMQIGNNGHTISVSVFNANFVATVKHEGVTYELAQFHFHWGGVAGGSEHTYDKKQFFAEVHFVHYNKKYSSLGEAADKSDGLLVWGHFIQAKNGTKDHAGMKKILDNFASVAYKDQTKTDMAYVPPMELIPAKHNDYYTYPGSLTTPRCFESVTWIVNRDIIDISPAQMEQFKGVYKTKQGEPKKSLLDNYRPVQALNGRTVLRNFDDSQGAASFVTASFITTMIAFIVYMIL